MTPVYACGWECGLPYQHWVPSMADWLGGTVSVQSTNARNSGQALQVAITGTGYGYVGQDVSGDATNCLVLRVYVYFATLPAANVREIFSVVTSTATYYLGFVQSTAKLKFGTSGSPVSSATTIQAATWYRVDLRIDTSANPHLLDWQINGVTQGSQITNAAASIGIGQLTFGTYATSDSGYTACYDDLVYSYSSADYPIGGGSIVGYRVTSASGTHAQAAGDLKNEAGTNVTNGDASGGKVNEATPDTTSYVQQVIARNTSYWSGIYDTSAATATPRTVEQFVATRAVSAGANDQKAQLYDGSSAADAYALTSTPAATLLYQRKHWAAAPSTGAWTLAKLQAARIRWGFSSTNTATYPPAISWTILEVESADVTAPVWTTPADTVSMSTTPDLKFTSPTSAVAQHFQLQLDTANTFDTGNLRTYDSSTSQTNWTYYNGSTWVAIPSGGLPAGYSGNEVDYTVTSALSAATWYRRVRAGA